MEWESRLEYCRRRWSLQTGDRLTGGFRSDVFSAVDAEGHERVVKLCASTGDARLETAALRVWAGSGAVVDLIDVATAVDAMLLGRIRPGTPMRRGDRPAVAVTAELLTRLQARPAGSHPFPRLSDVLPRLERVALADLSYERRTRAEPSRAEAGLRRLPAARRTLRRLADPTLPAVLQHGDPLTKNILADGTAPLGYRLIDPLPRMGDPCADVGMYAHDQPAATILDTAAELAGLMGLDVDRCVAWTVGWTALLVVQAWRDDQDELAALLDTPTCRRVLEAESD